MRPNYDTTLVAVRIPATIMAEIQARIIPWETGQTDVILAALCKAFDIENPKKVKADEPRQKEGHRGISS
jgi:hypothetical protein